MKPRATRPRAGPRLLFARSTLSARCALLARFSLFVRFALFACWLSAAGCGAQPAGPRAVERQITEQLSELERVAATLKSGEEETRRRGRELSAARELLAAGRVYQSLARLQPLQVELATRVYLDARAEVERGGVAAFEREWVRLGGEIEEKERRLAGLSGALPLAVLALAESAQAQARPTYDSGRLYGLNTTIADGLHYLGRASALLDFALFCRGLRFDEATAPAPLRALDAALRGLEDETLAAYRRAEAGTVEANERQGLFNRINSTLKLAAEMNGQGRRAGALHKFLEATLLFGLVEAAPPTAAELARLRDESAAFERRLGAEGEDHSLALLFWEPSRDALVTDATSDDATAEELRRAAVVLRMVLPAYFGDATFADAQPAPAGTEADAKTTQAPDDPTGKGLVTVTLIRWPDT